MQSRERPILFSTDMVKAILESRKTMTRRTKGIERIQRVNGMKTMTFPATGETVTYVDAAFKSFDVQINSGLIACPFGAIGDILWVREKFRYCQPFGCESLNYQYADGTIGEAVNPALHYRIDDYDRWRPSIHMPKIIARVWLQITDVKVESLDDITEQDAISEGVEQVGNQWRDYLAYDINDTVEFPEISFGSLWASINGCESWNANPFVWVISFKVLSTTGKPSTIPSGFKSNLPHGKEGLKSSPSGTLQEQVNEAHLLPGNGDEKEVQHG